VTKQSLLFGVAGVFFGILIGWIIGAQQAVAPAQPAPAETQASAAPAQQSAPAPLDESRVATLKAAADRDPKNAASRVELGNLYFDAERFPEAARWYEEALRLDPKNVNASTDLGITYYYMRQADRALAQFERSLTLDPKHSKTLMNVGIVRAFGKEDLEGATQAWERLIEVAPESEEARRARQAIQALKNHPPAQEGGSGSGRPPGSSE
jgi:cytochrome c-type biogenesis protein CcmH/NrfG